VPSEFLREAYRSEANLFFVGWVRGEYRLWVDGEHYLVGMTSDLEPIFLNLPLSRLDSHKPLRVAIQVFNNARLRKIPDYPDFVYGTGFVTKAKANTLRRSQFYWRDLVPTVSALLGVLLAIAILAAWLRSGARTAAPGVAALYVLLHAVAQIPNIESIWVRLSQPEYIALADPLAMAVFLSGPVLALAWIGIIEDRWVRGASLAMIVLPLVLMLGFRLGLLPWPGYGMQYFLRTAGMLASHGLAALAVGAFAFKRGRVEWPDATLMASLLGLGLLSNPVFANPYTVEGQVLWKWVLQLVLLTGVTVVAIYRTLKAGIRS
jgi:hypothetical protein